MPEKISIDEFLSKRKEFVTDGGALIKGAVMEKGFDAESRTGHFVVSTEEADRMRDVVSQDGLDITEFLKNPVALAFHRHTSPIGVWENVEKKLSGRPKRTEADFKAHPEGTTAASDEVANLLSVGGLKACSIGFAVREIDYIRDDKGVWNGGFFISASELLEVSICAVPANPSALLKAADGNTRLFAEALEYILDTYCEKTAGGIVVRKDFETAYLAMKAPKTTATPLQTKVFDTDGGPITVTVKTALELDTEEAERQAESFLEKWSKKFGDLFRIPADSATLLETKRYDLHERYREATFTKDAEGNVRVAGKWPELFAIVKDALDLDEMFSRDGKVVTIRCADSIAECNIDHEDEHFLFVSLTRSYDPPPTIVAGSRQKAVVASARMKQSLRERGLLT